MVLKLILIASLILVWTYRISPVEGAVNGVISCKDEGNKDVAWFIAYKIPKNPDSSDDAIKIGSAYFFLTPESSGWERSAKQINQADSIVGISTEQLFQTNHSSNMAFVLYNDQPPNGTAVTRNGHTKGIVLASNASAIWLVHSVPHFPIPGSTFGYPHGGLENGQIFLCLSMNLSSVDNVGMALQYTKPNIFGSSIPKNFVQLLPKLNQVVNKNATIAKAPWFTSFRVESGGLDFSVFVKGPKFRKEIYADWIAPELETGLNVQSWLNGAHPFQSNCTSSQFEVFNVLYKDISGHNFSTYNDHSKWGVGIQKETLCISDLNRMKPQKTRGGVALCVTNKMIWTAFKNIVSVLQPCNSTISIFTRFRFAK